MKKLAIALLLVLFPAVAMAGWNIRQNDDGSTVWVDGDSNTTPVGSAGLTVLITDLSVASTRMVVSDRAGKIKKFYGVIESAFSVGSDQPTISLLIQSTATAGQFTPISTGATLSLATGTAGANSSVTPSDSAVDVAEGQVIAITTDGASTGSVPGTITIRIE